MREGEESRREALLEGEESLREGEDFSKLGASNFV